MTVPMSGAKRVSIRFYAELNDFLPPARRGALFSVTVPVTSTLKDTIERLGAPYSEVDLILVGGEPAAGERVIEDGDRVSVFPVFESLDVSSVARPHPKPLRRTCFVADTDLAPLARCLRLLGFDSVCPAGRGDQELLRMSRDESRTLLTRDPGLLERGDVTRGYFLRASKPSHQVVEVVRRFDLVGSIRPTFRPPRPNL